MSATEEQAHCTEHERYESGCRWCRMRRRLQLDAERWGEQEEEVEDERGAA